MATETEEFLKKVKEILKPRVGTDKSISASQKLENIENIQKKNDVLKNMTNGFFNSQNLSGQEKEAILSEVREIFNAYIKTM